MALLSPQQVVVTGTTPSYGAVAASDTITPDSDRQFLIVKNASGTIDNCVLVIPGSTYGQANPDVTISVPITTGERWISIPPAAADPSTGLITVTHSQTTSVTCALVRV